MGGSIRTLHADEYLSQPVGRRRSELVAGAVVMNEPGVRHQRVAGRLLISLQTWVAAGTGRGEVFLPIDVRLDDANVYAPDVSWVAEDRRPSWDALGLAAPPDLAVEVRSRSTWHHDIGVKRSVYERSGLPELWLVDTAARSVLVYRRSSPTSPVFDVALELSGDATLTSPLLDDFALPVGEIFAEHMP